MQYILSNSDDSPSKGSGCIFCDFPKENNDEQRLIIHRGALCFVIMNAFPYNPGHLMVVPYRHTADFLSLTPNRSLCADKPYEAARIQHRNEHRKDGGSGYRPASAHAHSAQMGRGHQLYARFG